ncbi:MAG TPA: xanthine dehydrogenase family protein molybdopterin-binding subunit [Conexibacter sp.]|nr:xanthine dehydrogenase family protein molybdopterin-binding subunit [Conexibacter sp.]
MTEAATGRGSADGAPRPLSRHAIGRRILRREDPRLLAGHGCYTADVSPPGALHMAVVRSPLAHGRILAVDPAPALALDGVEAVLCDADVTALGAGPMPVAWRQPGQRNVANPLLAREKVLYVGQPVAVVLARDPYLAEDAAELVSLELEPLPAVTDALAALEPGAPLLHEAWGENVLAESVSGGGDPDARIDGAPIVLARRFRVHRHAGTPLETRAAVATYDPLADEVVAHLAQQVPHHARTVICEVCGWPESTLRVIAPDVGGGFGVKEYPYAEDALVCLLARRLRRPVKWVEDRREHFLSAVHARELVCDIELGAGEDGRIRGIRGRIVYDVGGHSSNQGIGPAKLAADMLPGPYDVQDYRMQVVGATTNKVPIGAYRGFGAPQAAFAMERLMDELAARTGLDRAEVRRRNFVAPDAFPYRAASGHLYDSGDYADALDRALERIGWDGFAAEREAAAAEGRLLGLGIASTVMAAGLAPSKILGMAGQGYGGWEPMLVRMDPSGRATVFTGSSAQGQGHATMMAQVCAERLGLDPEADVHVVAGDTGITPYAPASAIASRVGSVGAAAVLLASDAVADKLRALAAHALEASEHDVELGGGRAFVVGSPDRGVAIAELAHRAHLGHDLPDGVLPGLEATISYDPPNSSYPYATHAAVVELEPATGRLRILRYVVVHDCGTMVNPTIVEGQLIGGIVQGIGGALLERLAYDDGGQLLTTSFMDYLMPTAHDVPRLEVEMTETPTPFIPGGMKGMGEAGTLAPAAVLANAVADALGLEDGVDTLPLDPERVWTLARETAERARTRPRAAKPGAPPTTVTGGRATARRAGAPSRRARRRSGG